jgi:hypothetical protein
MLFASPNNGKLLLGINLIKGVSVLQIYMSKLYEFFKNKIGKEFGVSNNKSIILKMPDILQ